jgi:cell division protein YceG involved in septum cleavage
MVNKVFSLKKLIIFLALILVIICAILIGTYFYLINYHKNNGKEVTIYVPEGQTYSSIGELLKKND